MKKVVLVFIVFFSFFCFSQNENQSNNSSVLWGDYYFKNLNYLKAIKYYSMADKIESSESQRNYSIALELVNDLSNSQKQYQKLANSSQAKLTDYYKFANLLLKVYRVTNDGSIIKLSKEYKDKALRLPFESVSIYDDDSLLYKKKFSKPANKLFNLEINSSNADFGPIVIPNNKKSESSMILIYLTEQDESLKKMKRKKRISSELPIYNLVNTIFNVNNFKTSKINLYPEPLNSVFQEGPASYDYKNKILYFTRSDQKIDKNNQVQLSIYRLDISKIKSKIPELLDFNIEGYSTVHPTLNSNSSRIYFSSDRPGGYGGMDLYYVDILENGFSKPINLGPDINTKMDEVFPFIYNDKFLFYSTNGRESIGKLDIFMSELVAENRWQVYQLGSPYNSTEDDFSFSLSDKENFGFISTNREGGMGNDDIYSFKFNPNLIGLDDNYNFNLNDTLVVGNNNVTVNDEKNMIEIDPLSKLISKNVKLIDSTKNGYLKLNSNGTFLYHSKNRSIEKDSFYYALYSSLGNSGKVKVNLNRVKKKELDVNDKIPPIYYDFDKSNILTEYQSTLNDLIETLNQNPNLGLEIMSYADCRGSQMYNLELSNERAKSVINYIRSKVDNKNRVFGRGFGEINLSKSKNCDCCNLSEKEHFLNRRTEFIYINNLKY